MKALKALGRRLLFPPLFLALPVIVLSAALLTYVFAAGLADTPIAYAAYTLSFYALLLACTSIPRLIRLSQRARQYEHVDRFLSD